MYTGTGKKISTVYKDVIVFKWVGVGGFSTKYAILKDGEYLEAKTLPEIKTIIDGLSLKSIGCGIVTTWGK